MIDLFQPLSLGTNLCQGYGLEEALDIVKRNGFEYAELCSIVTMWHHVDPKDMTPEYAESIKNLLDSKGMKCYAISGHVDPTIDSQCEMLLKKIEFAGRIGAAIVNTNAGDRSRRSEFYKNMRKLIAMAEKWNVVIGLESHGDIVHTAQESVPIFKEFNHPLVRLNYDTGNTYYYCNGNIKIEDDIKYGAEYLSYIHLKDIRVRGSFAEYCPIGEGDINFPAIISWMVETFGKGFPCGLEIPVQCMGGLGNIGQKNYPLHEKVIHSAVSHSVEYLEHLQKTI